MALPKHNVARSLNVPKATAKTGVAKHLRVSTESAVLEQESYQPPTLKFVFCYVDGDCYPLRYTAGSESAPVSETVSPILSQFHRRIYHIFVPNAEPFKGVDCLNPLHALKGTKKQKAGQQKKRGRNAKRKS